MRVVLDTNIFVSGLLSSVGPPARIVQAVLQRRLIPVMSPVTFAELDTVVHRPKLQPAFARAGVNLETFLATVRTEAQFMVPRPTRTPLRDEHDRPFLDLMATIPSPQYFVTGDKDFDARSTAAFLSSPPQSSPTCSNAPDRSPFVPYGTGKSAPYDISSLTLGQRGHCLTFTIRAPIGRVV